MLLDQAVDGAECGVDVVTAPVLALLEVEGGPERSKLLVHLSLGLDLVELGLSGVDALLRLVHGLLRCGSGLVHETGRHGPTVVRQGDRVAVSGPERGSVARRTRALALAAAFDSATGVGRWHGEVAGVPVVSLGVAADWSVQAHVGEQLPDDRQLTELLETLDTLGSHGFQVMVGHEHRRDPRWARHGLHEVYQLPTFALPADVAAQLAVRLRPELTVRPAEGREEFVDVYGGWCGGHHLAEALVTVEDVTSGRHEYWVAEAEGTLVGTAMLHHGERSQYLSGIGVLVPFRGRGYGSAITALATVMAAGRLDAEGRPVDLVWMHASGDGAPLYERMGFQEVDRHVGLGTGQA